MFTPLWELFCLQRNQSGLLLLCHPMGAFSQLSKPAAPWCWQSQGAQQHSLTRGPSSAWTLRCWQGWCMPLSLLEGISGCTGTRVLCLSACWVALMCPDPRCAPSVGCKSPILGRQRQEQGQCGEERAGCPCALPPGFML